MSKALLRAAAAGQNAKLEALLAAGADIDFADRMPGRTALIEAAVAGHADAVHLLIERGANLNLSDQALGYTALAWAAYRGDHEMVQRLLKAGAQVDLTTNQFQHTPLMVAAQAGNSDVVAALIEAGADLHIETGDGRNALSMAEANDCGEISTRLRQRGARLPEPRLEAYLPWPSLKADLSDVDDADPASVLRGFILAMNRWELACEQHRQAVADGPLDWARIHEEQGHIFARFCTSKSRPQGRCGSFGSPPEYSIEEALASADVIGGRATLMTRQGPDRAMRYEALYSLVRKSKMWRIDCKKRRPWGTEKWDKGTL